MPSKDNDFLSRVQRLAAKKQEIHENEVTKSSELARNKAEADELEQKKLEADPTFQALMRVAYDPQILAALNQIWDKFGSKSTVDYREVTKRNIFGRKITEWRQVPIRKDFRLKMDKELKLTKSGLNGQITITLELSRYTDLYLKLFYFTDEVKPSSYADRNSPSENHPSGFSAQLIERESDLSPDSAITTYLQIAIIGRENQASSPGLINRTVTALSVEDIIDLLASYYISKEYN